MGQGRRVGQLERGALTGMGLVCGSRERRWTRVRTGVRGPSWAKEGWGPGPRGGAEGGVGVLWRAAVVGPGVPGAAGYRDPPRHLEPPGHGLRTLAR